MSIAQMNPNISVEECMARRVELVGIVIEKCDETFHVDRRERAQPGNGEKRVFAFVGSVLSLLLSSSHTSLTILSTFSHTTNQGTPILRIIINAQYRGNTFSNAGVTRWKYTYTAEYGEIANP